MYGYVYLTENLIDGRCYIGQHKPHKKDHLDLWYKGSGKIIGQAIEKYGKENFITTIIEWCRTKEELIEREEYWIRKCNAIESPLFYNISPKGSGGAVAIGWKQSDYQKQRASEANKGIPKSDETKQKLKEVAIAYYKENKDWIYENLIEANKKHTGMHWYTNGIDSKEYFDTDEIPEGWYRGRPKELRKKVSEGRKKSLKTKNTHWYTNGVKDRRFHDGDEIPEGYYLGKCYKPWNKKN